MSHSQPLLIELGTEELPVQALPALARAFHDNIMKGLAAAGLTGDPQPAGDGLLYTPRRLAVRVPDVATRQPDQSSQVAGPYLDIALDDDGQPTRALQGFAARAGVDWTQLERLRDNKGERFVHRSLTPGAHSRDLLPRILATAIKDLPIAKPMRWGGHEHAFVRPVHWLLVLHGDQVVDCEVFGVASGRDSRGHRFHHPGAVAIGHPDTYVRQLESARVIVVAAQRKSRIRHQVEALAERLGGRALIEDAILDQVNCLTEWPVALAGSFDRDFLRVPHAALVETMAVNQKFFPVLDADGRLCEHFIGVANIESSQPEEIRKGYQRVIRPRFADARFFFDEDLKQGLSAMNAGLAQVTYQAALGTLADKVERLAELAGTIADTLGADSSLVRRAAGLAKADLQSRMVNEFPELQGIAGSHYARHDPALADLAEEERVALATALDEIYMPRQAGDAIAATRPGQVLAIAERIDTLAGGFAAGLKPTGNRDPFALRRNALGLARTLIEAGLDLDLPPFLDAAVAQVHAHMLRQGEGTELARAATAQGAFRTRGGQEIYRFVIERLRGYYEQKDEYDANRFAAVAAVEPGSLVDFDLRLQALREFAGSADGQALAAANKRCGNLLRKAAESGECIADQVQDGLLQDDAERELVVQIEAAADATAPLFARRDYVAALARLARLRPAVDAFFDQVMVMADDPAVRAQRLGLLRRLQTGFMRIADIGRLAGS